MTALNRPIKRVTGAKFQGKNLVIAIEPVSLPSGQSSAIIKVKEKGTHTWFSTTVEAVYSFAVKQEVERKRKEKKENRKIKREV